MIAKNNKLKICRHGHSYRMEDRLKNRAGCPRCGRDYVNKHHRVKSRRKTGDPRRVARTIAKEAVYLALKSGSITRLPCSVCGSTEKIEAHHEDYTKPLDVIWFCQKHHHERHVTLRKEKSGPIYPANVPSTSEGEER